MAEEQNRQGLAASDKAVTGHPVPESDIGQLRARSDKTNQRLKQYAKALFRTEE